MNFRKRKIPEINSTSSADIAFLLLVFFLVTSSFDAKTGIYRKMMPPETENAQKQKTDIQQKNLLALAIDADNHILYNDEAIAVNQIRELGKTFITGSDIPKHTIALEVNRDARYQTYLSVISELTAAYNELRNEAAYTDFNHSFLYLTPEQKDSIRTAYPMHIAETESPVEQEGGRS
ncbi:MAG: biopolymer transporter ExbD [Dysgonamonadaceae bacterium]|jgi:biopolymer transport protein ExbD|nr:biopolymer transporter ExbD [Dysgonamonadaceae bacterium]